jgi:hypothetical protein
MLYSNDAAGHGGNGHASGTVSIRIESTPYKRSWLLLASCCLGV